MPWQPLCRGVPGPVWHGTADCRTIQSVFSAGHHPDWDPYFEVYSNKPVRPRATPTTSEHPAANRPPPESADHRKGGEAEQHKQRRAGDPDEPVEPGNEPMDPVVPGLAQPGARRRWRDRALTGLGKRHSEGAVGRLTVEDVEL